MRSMTTVFLHSRLERTPMGNWMWFFCNTDGDHGLWNVGVHSSLPRSSIPVTAHSHHKIFTDRQIRRVPDCGAARLWHISFSWHYLLPLHHPIRPDWMRCGGSINSASGVLWMTNVTASFAPKSLPAGKLRLLMVHTGTDSHG